MSDHSHATVQDAPGMRRQVGKSLPKPATLSITVLGLYLLFVASMVPPPPLPAPQSRCEVAVLAAADDPYYVLAQEIARTENAPLGHTLAEAAACHPVYLLWVVSPDFLSDAVMVEFGLALQEQPALIATGVISASTIEGARALWQRRWQAQGAQVFAANAANTSAHIYDGRIRRYAPEPTVRLPLTLMDFTDVLQQADYLTFTGHGASGYLRLDEDTKFTAADVPALDALVVGTGSCQTVRLWQADSIALRFVDQGAAGYSGFVYSPNEGYLMGEFSGLPFRYTWQDFPVGLVIQLQNRGTQQGFARFSYQFLMGDPRLALQAAPAYRLVSDQQAGDQRTLVYQDVPAGVIPIRIAAGAAFRYVEAVGITAAADQDPFYNSRLQMLNLAQDKLVLLEHAGGDLTLRLRLRPAWYWFAGDMLLDSLEHTFIFSPQSGGDGLAAAFALLPLGWVGWQIFRRRLSHQKVRLALAVGLGAAVLQGGYSLARSGQVTITSKTVVFSPLSVLAGFLLGLCGALIFLQARSPVGKGSALLVMTFPSWAPMAFGLAVIAGINFLGFIPEIGTALYNYALGLLPVGALLLMFYLSCLALWLIKACNPKP